MRRVHLVPAIMTDGEKRQADGLPILQPVMVAVTIGAVGTTDSSGVKLLHHMVHVGLPIDDSTTPLVLFSVSAQGAELLARELIRAASDIHEVSAEADTPDSDNRG